MADLESILKVEIKLKKRQNGEQGEQRERREREKNEEQTRHVGAKKMNQ